jgi:TPR repeat protein
MRSVLVGAFAVAALTAMGLVHAAEGLDRAIAAIEAYDYPRALPPLREAATSGDRRAQRLLGFMLLHGEQLYRGVRADPAEAMAWLRKASEQGDEQAAWVVARIERSRVATTTPR